MRQLSGHLRAGVIGSTNMRNRVRFQTKRKRTAERALTAWSRRKVSRKVRSQASNKLEVQQEGQLSGHLHTGVVENYAKEKDLAFERAQGASKRES
jgi:hypothetical protein